MSRFRFPSGAAVLRERGQEVVASRGGACCRGGATYYYRILLPCMSQTVQSEMVVLLTPRNRVDNAAWAVVLIRASA